METNNQKKYVLVEYREYYDDTLGVTDGYRLYDNDLMCIKEAGEKLKELRNENYYMAHGQAGGYFDIAEVIAEDVEMQYWLDNFDWTGCPHDLPFSEDEHDENIKWAFEKSMLSGINLYVYSDNYDYSYGMILNVLID